MTSTDHPTTKTPFDIDDMMRRLRRATKPFEPAAMFVLKDEGYGSLFQVLVGCIISIRTYERTTLAAARKLFAEARTPRQIAALTTERIDSLIGACTFHTPKAKRIRDIAVRTVREFGGELPADKDVLLGFSGVGSKCAALALGVATGKPYGVPVDIHVHRVTNRWGYVHSSTPELTMIELQEKLPRRYWLQINKLLVPFGKHICTGTAPKCTTCPLLQYCRQVGVTKHR